jgi:hypothetical protein
MVLISWIAGLYIGSGRTKVGSFSLSRRAADSKLSYAIFVFTLIVGGGLFYLWVLGWLAPEIGLGILFSLLLTVTFIGQLIVGLVPDVKGMPSKIHNLVAQWMFAFYIPLSFMMLTAQDISDTGRLASLICFLVLAVVGGRLLFVPNTRNDFLPLETVYIVVFQIQILAVAYL